MVMMMVTMVVVMRIMVMMVMVVVKMIVMVLVVVMMITKTRMTLASCTCLLTLLKKVAHKFRQEGIFKFAKVGEHFGERKIHFWIT